MDTPITGSFEDNPYGIFNTSFNIGDINKPSFRMSILKLFPDGGNSPLYALTGMTGKTKAVQSLHSYYRKKMAYSSMIIDNGGGHLDSDTTINVESTLGVVPNMIFENASTREHIRVLTVPSTTQITVERSFGRISAAAIADDEVFFCVGNAHDEGSNRPTARRIPEEQTQNYTQIFRNSWGVTGTAMASMNQIGESNVAKNRRDCMALHSTEIESALLFGQMKASTGNPPVHATQGLIDAVYQYAPNNVTTAGATTTYNQLVAMVENMFDWSADVGTGSQRLLFCDNQAFQVINDIGLTQGEVQYSIETTSFGLQFSSFKFSRGEIILKRHPLLNGLSTPSGLAIGVDLPTMKIAYLGDRDAYVEEYFGSKDGSNSGIDAQGGSLTTEFATEFVIPESYCVINDLTQAA